MDHFSISQYIEIQSTTIILSNLKPFQNRCNKIFEQFQHISNNFSVEIVYQSRPSGFFKVIKCLAFLTFENRTQAKLAMNQTIDRKLVIPKDDQVIISEYGLPASLYCLLDNPIFIRQYQFTHIPFIDLFQMSKVAYVENISRYYRLVLGKNFNLLQPSSIFWIGDTKNSECFKPMQVL